MDQHKYLWNTDSGVRPYLIFYVMRCARKAILLLTESVVTYRNRIYVMTCSGSSQFFHRSSLSKLTDNYGRQKYSDAY